MNGLELLWKVLRNRCVYSRDGTSDSEVPENWHGAMG